MNSSSTRRVHSMEAIVDKRDDKGRVSWCASFAQDTTARRFVDQQNRIYGKHLTFFLRGEESDATG